MRHTYVRHERTGGEHCQQITPLGVVPGARGELLCSSMASCSSMDGSVVASSGPCSGRGVDSSGGNSGGSCSACVGGGCGLEEGVGLLCQQERLTGI